jgi:PTS system nitrogen regulatory IIA component
MRIVELLYPERVSFVETLSSKKRALETLCEMLSQGHPATENVPFLDFFDALTAREKLGSTGLGHGVAIPHGRLAKLAHPRVAILRLAQGVDFESIDHEPVDILIALAVPESSTGTHLQLLGQIASVLSQPDCRAQLRRTADAPTLFTTAVDVFTAL